MFFKKDPTETEKNFLVKTCALLIYAAKIDENYTKKEEEIICSKCDFLNNNDGKKLINNMVKVANLSRNGFANGDISTVMSPRTVITWAQVITVRGLITVDMSPFAKPFLDKLATFTILLISFFPSLLFKKSHFEQIISSSFLV